MNCDTPKPPNKRTFLYRVMKPDDWQISKIAVKSLNILWTHMLCYVNINTAVMHGHKFQTFIYEI